jgi:hypothetical protein
MESRRLWRVAIGVVATGLVLAALLVLGGRLSDPFGRGLGLGAARAASYKTPPGQPAATDLTVDRLRDAFNNAAREPRIVLSLSPT